MALRDFSPLSGDIKNDPNSLMDWLKRLDDRQNIDLQIALSVPAANDEIGILDVSAGKYCSITLSNLLTAPFGAITATSINFGQTTLSYYGEGTWTPIDSSGAALTFTNPTGTYERIGRQFTARFALQYPVTVSGSSTLIGGLPFTVSNNEESRQGFITVSNLALPSTPVPNVNAATFILRNQQTTVIFTNAQVSASIFYGTVSARV